MKTNEKLQKKNDKLKKKADKADEIIQKVKCLKKSFQTETETDNLNKEEQNSSKKRKIHKKDEDILFFKNLQKELIEFTQIFAQKHIFKSNPKVGRKRFFKNVFYSGFSNSNYKIKSLISSVHCTVHIMFWKLSSISVQLL